MHAVLGAEIVILVHAAAVIRIIIQQVVGTVSQEKTQGQNQPGQKGKLPKAHGQQPGDGTRI